jgi:hypothetical protein
MMWGAARYWQDIEDWVTQCDEWQQRNIASVTWTKKMKPELDKKGLAYIWQNKLENIISKLQSLQMMQ